MNSNPEIQQLRDEIEAIKARNKKVEADKAWEISWARRIFIAVSTYILVSILFLTTATPDPFISAIIPALAYLVSTLSLEIIKQQWLEKRKS